MSQLLDWAVRMVPTGEPWVAIFKAYNKEQALQLAEEDTATTLLADFVGLEVHLATDEDRQFAMEPMLSDPVQFVQILKWRRPSSMTPPIGEELLLFYKHEDSPCVIRRAKYEQFDAEGKTFCYQEVGTLRIFDTPDMWARLEIPTQKIIPAK